MTKVERRQNKVAVERQEVEEYLIVRFKVRQGLVEDLWLAWRYQFGRMEKQLW